MKLKITLMVLVASLVATGSAGARSQAACAVKGSKTVLANDHARVFRITKEKEDPRNGRRSFFDFFYACPYRTNTRSYLGADHDVGPWDCLSSFGEIGHLRLARAHVAYSTSFCTPHGEVGMIVSVVSLRSGGKRRLRSVVGPPPPSVPCLLAEQCLFLIGGGPSTKVTALKPNANGAVAWIGQELGVYNPISPLQFEPYTLIEVRKAESSGSDVVLDSGADLDPRSLRLSRDGSTVYWTKAGAESSAPLN